MNELTIGGEVYAFNFGIGFMRALDKTLTVEEDHLKGVYRKVGLSYTIANLINYDIEALMTILDLANKGQKPRLTPEALAKHIEDPDTDIEALIDEVVDFLSTANVTKKLTTTLLEAMRSAEK